MAIGIISKDEFEKESGKANASDNIIIPKDNKEINKELNDKLKESHNEVKALSVIDNMKYNNTKAPYRGAFGGRDVNHTNISPEIREIIAELSVEGYSNGELKNITNLSQSSISAYKNGATSTTKYNEPSESLVNHINKRKEHIASRARKVIVTSLNLLTPEKINTEKPRDIALIARSMSAIVKDMEPQVIQQNNDNRVQYTIFAPAMRQESSYEVMDVIDADV